MRRLDHRVLHVDDQQRHAPPLAVPHEPSSSTGSHHRLSIPRWYRRIRSYSVLIGDFLPNFLVSGGRVHRPMARVLTVLELLQARKRISGVELARRLEVDGRTVRRYVATLQEMGSPWRGSVVVTGPTR
ncbi:MAG: hypothetical protein CYG60_25505 [Actinobacteria bacterium]|nr:MAG: hypothetical protein CYG60_25505 [Actinomycetota bacterium]